MRTLFAVVFALGAVGSLAAQVAVPVPPTKIAVSGRNGPPRILTDTMGTAYEVPYAAGRVFTALGKVYAELKIKVELSDSALLQVGNPSFNTRGTIGGRRVSAYLNCGSGMSGEFADSYPIYVSLVTFIKSTDPANTTIRTVLMANAYNVTEGARPTQNCWSNGEFESRISKLTLKYLASP